MEHVKSLLPAGKKWKLVWNDEFDGTELDMTKWSFRYHLLHKRQMCLTDETASLDGKGNLVLSLMEKDGHFYCSQIQTGENYMDRPGQEFEKDGFAWPIDKFSEPKFMHKYGYYEIRCRLPKCDGWHCAFWLQSPSIGAHPDPAVAGVECDIMENYRQHKFGTMVCGCGWGGYGAEGKWAGHYEFPLEETEDGWHNYAVHWTPDGYTFYADGKIVGKQMAPECAVSQVEQFLLVTTECHGYNRVFKAQGEAGEVTKGCCAGEPVPELFEAKLPDVFEVDYVRVFDEI